MVVILLRVVFFPELQVVAFLAILDLRALSFSALVLVLSFLLLFLFTPPMSRWLGTGFPSLLTPVSDHLLIYLTIDFCRIEA